MPVFVWWGLRESFPCFPPFAAVGARARARRRPSPRASGARRHRADVAAARASRGVAAPSRLLPLEVEVRGHSVQAQPDQPAQAEAGPSQGVCTRRPGAQGAQDVDVRRKPVRAAVTHAELWHWLSGIPRQLETQGVRRPRQPAQPVAQLSCRSCLQVGSRGVPLARDQSRAQIGEPRPARDARTLALLLTTPAAHHARCAPSAVQHARQGVGPTGVEWAPLRDPGR